MQVLYDIEIPSQEDEIFEEITLTKGSIWVVFPQSTKYQITAVQKDNLGNIMAQRKFGLNFDLTQATEDLTINLQSNAPKGTTIKAFYSNYFFFELGRGIGTGGGSGGETLTFNSPLEKSNGSVSLDYADDLGLDEQNNLTLKLQNNSDFQAIKENVITEYKKYFVVVCAGQSNSVGYDESPHTFLNISRNPKRILQLGAYGENNLKLIPLGVCAENMQDIGAYMERRSLPPTKGMHLPLANAILEYLPDDYAVVVIPVAFGESSFTNSSLPQGTLDESTLLPTNFETDRANTSLPGGKRYGWGIDSVYAKIIYERTKYVMGLGDSENNIFGGIIWLQGESDNGNPSGQKTKFQEMANDILTKLNNNFSKQTTRGAIDSNMWFNVETTIYWYTLSGVVTIWDNYKEWNPNSYVSIPRSQSITNRQTRSTATSSNMMAHFGANAYLNVVVPRIIKQMELQKVFPLGRQGHSVLAELQQNFYCLEDRDVSTEKDTIWRPICDNDFVAETNPSVKSQSGHFDDTITIGPLLDSTGYWLDDSIDGIEFVVEADFSDASGNLIIIADDGNSEAHTSLLIGKTNSATYNKLFFGSASNISFENKATIATGISRLSSPINQGSKVRITKVDDSTIEILIDGEGGQINLKADDKQGNANVFTTNADTARIRFGIGSQYTANKSAQISNFRVYYNQKKSRAKFLNS